VGALQGAYVIAHGLAFSDTGPEWVKDRASDAFPEIVEDDGDVCADLALVHCDGLGALEQVVREFGVRCDRVVGVLPWGDRERLWSGLPGVRVLRHVARLFRGDAVLAVWEQSSWPTRVSWAVYLPIGKPRACWAPPGSIIYRSVNRIP